MEIVSISEIPSSILGLCIGLTKKSNHPIFRIAAVIFKSKRIYGVGYNQLRHIGRISPKYKDWDNSLHAEQKALLGTRHDLKGMSILIVRLFKNGDFGISKPCAMCQRFIAYKQLRYMYYFDIEGNFIRERVHYD